MQAMFGVAWLMSLPSLAAIAFCLPFCTIKKPSSARGNISQKSTHDKPASPSQRSLSVHSRQSNKEPENKVPEERTKKDVKKADGKKMSIKEKHLDRSVTSKRSKTSKKLKLNKLLTNKKKTATTSSDDEQDPIRDMSSKFNDDGCSHNEIVASAEIC